MSADFVISNVIDWNDRQMRKAKADAENPGVRVPFTAKKRVHEDGRSKLVLMTRDEYRADRRKDAWRHSNNIEFLRTKQRRAA